MSEVHDESAPMTPEQRKAVFDSAAQQIMGIVSQLTHVGRGALHDGDQAAFDQIMTDLIWAAENCSVLGAHQVSAALDDTMGYEPGGGCA